jgi:hypothetical protein
VRQTGTERIGHANAVWLENVKEERMQVKVQRQRVGHISVKNLCIFWNLKSKKGKI